MLRQLLTVFTCVWLAIIGNISSTTAQNRPVAGKSEVIANESVKKVDKLTRKVVFFQKDIDLPCLRVPVNLETEQHFSTEVKEFGLLRGSPLSTHVEMSKDGDLLFLCDKAICRITNGNRAETLVKLSELNVSDFDKLPKSLHFDRLLHTPATADFLYMELSNIPKPSEQQASLSPVTYLYFVGRLDVKEKQLRVVPIASPYQIEIDPDAGWIYEPHKGGIERKDFDGKVTNRWPLSVSALTCYLSPDKQSLLICRADDTLSLLDLKNGGEKELHIQGRAAAWGSGETIFYINENTKGNVLDTSLYSYQIGKKEPKRLFLVSCRREKMKDTLFGMPPCLSTDLSWLSWYLPVEDYNEYGTILLDLKNNEYCILKGQWNGVQW